MAEKIKLTFLGTGSAVPTKRRNHPSILIQYKEHNLLFDCGEGTQRQFRKAGINPCKLTKIFISHWHGDHVLGLAGLIQTLAMNAYNGKLEIYGPKNSKKQFAELVEPHLGYYLKLSKMEGNNFSIEVHEEKAGKIFETEEFVVDAEETQHGTNSLAYSFTIKEKERIDKEKLTKLKIPNGPALGELAKGKTITLDGKKIDGKKLLYTEPQRKIAIISDTKYTKDLEKFAKDSDVLISEATYAKEEEELASEHFHMTCTQTATIAKNSKSKKLILFHMSQRYDEIPKLLKGQAQEIFKNTEVAEDLDAVELD